MIKILKYSWMDVSAKKPVSSFVVISIVVLILAVVSVQGPNRTDEVAGLYTPSGAIWHGPDCAGRTRIGQSLNLKHLSFADVRKSIDSDLWPLPDFGKNLDESETQLLVAHIDKSARSSRLEKWSWQPAIRG